MNGRALVLAALGVTACKAAPNVFPDDDRVPPSPVRVNFRPPEDTPIVERTVTTRSEGSGTARSVQTVKATLTSRFERNDGGWLLSQKMEEVRLERDGTPFESPMVKLISQLELRVRLAGDGAFVALDRPESVDAAVDAAFPDPQQAAQVRRFFTSQAISQETQREWDAKYGGLLGREVVPGHAWYTPDALGAAGGPERRFLVERKVTQIRMGESGRDLVVALSCPANAEAAANPDAFKAAGQASNVAALDGAIRCSGEQLVQLDPFLPVSFNFESSGSLPDGSGQPREVQLSRSVRAEGVGATEAETDGGRPTEVQ